MFRQGPFLSAPSSAAMWAQSDNPNVASNSGHETSFLEDGIYGSATLNRPMMHTAAGMYEETCAKQMAELEAQYHQVALANGQDPTGHPNPSSRGFNMLKGIRSKQAALQKKMKGTKEHFTSMLKRY